MKPTGTRTWRRTTTHRKPAASRYRPTSLSQLQTLSPSHPTTPPTYTCHPKPQIAMFRNKTVDLCDTTPKHHTRISSWNLAAGGGSSRAKQLILNLCPPGLIARSKQGVAASRAPLCLPACSPHISFRFPNVPTSLLACQCRRHYPQRSSQTQPLTPRPYRAWRTSAA